MVRVKLHGKQTYIHKVKTMIASQGRAMVKKESTQDRWCGKKHCVETLFLKVSKFKNLTSDSLHPKRITLQKGTCRNLEFHCGRKLDSAESCLTQRVCSGSQWF